MAADEFRSRLEGIERMHRRGAQAGFAQGGLAQGAIVLQPLPEHAAADDAKPFAPQLFLLRAHGRLLEDHQSFAPHPP